MKKQNDLLVKIGLIFTVLLTLGFNISVKADDVLNKFDVKKVPSEHQFNQNVAYFDLLLQPSESDKLVVLLENNSEESLKLELSVNRAVTNQNGVVEYSGASKKESKTAVNNIEELVTLSDNELILKPKEKKEIQLEVKMPEKAFSGIVAGALYVIEIPQTEAEGTVRNILSREIAILLRNSEEEVTPKIEFHEAKAIHSNERNAIEINMENTAATYIKDVTLTYEIMHGKEEFLKGEKKAVKIAPNSLFPFVINLNEKEFEAGDYSVAVKLNSGEKEWKEELPFLVEKEEADKLNKTNVSLAKKEPFPWSTVILVSVLIVFSGLVFYLIQKNQKLKKEIKRKSKKRNKKASP